MHTNSHIFFEKIALFTRFENKVREEWMMEKFAEFDINLIYKTGDKLIKQENIAPTNSIMTLMNDKEDVLAETNKWGIKFAAASPLIFNSRIETITGKPFWKMLFDKNRCLVPMTAFYEWKKEKTKKVPYRIFLKSQEVFYVPALYNKDKEGNKTISLITTEPNEFMKGIHHRMPVILELQEAIKYLSGDLEENLDRCIPYENSENMDVEIADIYIKVISTE